MAKAVADVNNPEEKQGGFASDDSDITGFSHMHDSGTGGVWKLQLRTDQTRKTDHSNRLHLLGIFQYFLNLDAQVIGMDLEGGAVSAGAACSSGKVQTSHVLTAMGLGSLAGQAIRVSLPWNVTDDAIDAFEAAYARMAARLRPALVPADA